MDPFIEKRKDNRCDIRKMTFVIFPDDKMNICRLVDISKGGIAFIYPSTEFELTADLQLIDILCDDITYIKGIKTKIISNIKMDEYPSFSQTVMKRCGMQFLDLSENKRTQIDKFLYRMET